MYTLKIVFVFGFLFLLSCWFRQTKIHNIGATLVGVDKIGNKYYERLGDEQYGWYSCFLLSYV